MSSILELTDEGQALRKAARGWSRGEISLEDYRAIRRATLEGMLGMEPGSSEEEESAAESEAASPSADAVPDDTPTVDATAEDGSSSDRDGDLNRPLVLIAVGGVLIVIAALIVRAFV